MTARTVVKTVLLVGAAVGLLLFGREAAAQLPAFGVWVRTLGPWGPLAYILGYGVAALLLLPCVVLTLAAGALWGVVAGATYAMLGASLGAVLAFVVSRRLVRLRVQTYVARHPRLAAIDRAVEAEGLRLVFLLRLSPAVPYVLLNYVLGVSRVRFRDYVVGLSGMVPVAVAYVYAGKVAGDAATLAAGGGTPKGPAYYSMLIAGLLATVAASVLVAKAAGRAVQQQL